MAELDAAGTYSVGAAGLGIAFLDGSGPFRALLPGAQADSQEAERLGQASAFASQTLVAGTKTGRGDGVTLRPGGTCYWLRYVDW